jgi:hypothetical protein
MLGSKIDIAPTELAFFCDATTIKIPLLRSGALVPSGNRGFKEDL